MVAAEPGVDDHQVVAGVEQVGVAAGGELEAPETDPVRDPDLLDVGEEAVALGLAEATARREAGLEGPGRVASPVLEFLDHVVDVLEQAEQEPVVGVVDQIPDLFREPDVVDGVVEPSRGRVVLDDLETEPRLEPVQQDLDGRRLREVQGQLDPFGVDTAVVEVDRGDVRAGIGDLLQELEETTRAVGEPDIEGQEPERGKTRLQVTHLLEPADDACIPVRRAGDLEEDDVPVDPVVVLDPVDVDGVRPEQFCHPVKGAGLVGHTGDERVPVRHGDRYRIGRAGDIGFAGRCAAQPGPPVKG